MGWVREVMKAVEKLNPGLNVTLRANDIGELCKDLGIDIPNHKTPFRDGPFGEDAKNQHIGRLLGVLYQNLMEQDPNANAIRIERVGMRRIRTLNNHGKYDNSYNFYHTP